MIAENTSKYKWNFIQPSSSKMNRFSLLIFAMFLAQISFSQRKRPPIFPTDEPYFKNWGWYAGIGANYSLGVSGKTDASYNENTDTSFQYTFTPRGKVGMMIEGGAFYLLDNKYVSVLDAGLRFNWFNGKENFEEYQVNQTLMDTVSNQNGNQQFSMMNISLRLDASNAIQVSKYGFIQNTLGLNFDYRFYDGQKVDPENFSFPFEPFSLESQSAFQVQLHYKIAYGFRLDLMHYMIIGIDTPIFTALPWENGSPAFAFFSSEYLPLTLSVRVLFLRKSNRPDCNKPAPLDTNKKRKEAKMF